MRRGRIRGVDHCCFHITHRCQERRFLLKFEIDRKNYVKRLDEASRKYTVDILDYVVTRYARRKSFGSALPVRPTQRAGISCRFSFTWKTTILGSTYFHVNKNPSRTAPCTPEGFTPSVSRINCSSTESSLTVLVNNKS